MKKFRRKKRGPVVSKKITFDGITFSSGLEKYMYIALKKLRSTQYMRVKLTKSLKVLIFQTKHMKDAVMEKEIIKTEVVRKSLI